MEVMKWLIDCCFWRGKAMYLYKRGMVKANRHDHQGAICDYSTLIDSPDTSDDLRAMVLYNRALVYVAIGDEERGAADLDSLLAMDDPHTNIKTMARQKRARMKHRDSKCDS